MTEYHTVFNVLHAVPPRQLFAVEPVMIIGAVWGYATVQFFRALPVIRSGM